MKKAKTEPIIGVGVLGSAHRHSKDRMRTSCCLGGAAVRHRTRDREVAGSTPGRGAIKSTMSTQPSIPPG